MDISLARSESRAMIVFGVGVGDRSTPSASSQRKGRACGCCQINQLFLLAHLFSYEISNPRSDSLHTSATTIINYHFENPFVVYSIISFLLQQIFIKTLTGRKQAFNFEPENQVLAVKQALQEKEGIQVDQIRLIFSGKQLSDDRTLESYAIAAGATIHMVLQLRGGER
jgi:hypothetical protein